MTLEQALEKIQEQEKQINTLTGEKVKLKGEVETLTGDLTSEKAKTADIKTRADKSKSHLKSVFEAFGIEEGTAADDAIATIKEKHESLTKISTDYETLAPYKTYKTTLDNLIKKESADFLKLYEEHKDNEQIMSFINFDPKADADNIDKINSSHTQLKKLVALANGANDNKKKNDPFFNPLGKEAKSPLDNPTPGEQTEQKSGWVDFSKLD